MMQTIKSLAVMMNSVQVKGFQFDRFKKGDYGYNLVYGVVDDKIQVGFRVDYQKDDDPNAINNIKQSITDDVELVRTINSKLSPKGSSLVKFIDGWHMLSYDMGYEVEGKTIEFAVPKFYSVKNEPNKLPIPYSDLELVKIMKNTIKANVKKLKKELKAIKKVSR